MDSLLSAFFSAQVGRLQLAVAARLARTDANSPVNPDVAPSVTNGQRRATERAAARQRRGRFRRSSRHQLLECSGTAIATSGIEQTGRSIVPGFAGAHRS